MCGIAGFRSEVKVPSQVLRDMVEAMRHRGPDADGFFSDGPYQAGMRRLSINDPAGGMQPLLNEDGSVVLLYNGEIYNSPSLRRELETKGHRFRTRSDGEVICHLYEEEGESLFERLDGMFGAALWIVPERKLILARDLPGEKPLYYGTTSRGDLAFASEIHSLRRFPGLDLSIDRQSIWDFPTFLWVPEPATVFAGIKALPRGHMLISQGRNHRLVPYRNRFNAGALPTEDGAIAAETRRVVEEAVKSRLLSDVPIGSFLSGGLDSSIVATVAQRELGDLHTFTIGFEDLSDPYHGRADEAEQAGSLAARLGTRHHLLRVTADTFRDLLPVFCARGDQPFAVSSGLGILAISRMAREAGVKVLLSGDGADECFGGYSWYAHLGDCAAARGAGPETARGGGPLVTYQNFGLDLNRRLQAMGGYPAHLRAWAWHYYAAESEKESLFERGFGEGLAPSTRHFERFKDAPEWTPEDYVAQDRDFYFPQEMLRKLDRMTMGFSVEGRVPFAAPSVLSHAAKLGYSSMVREGELKYALRRAFSDILPADVVSRPKHGFNVPIDHWLKTGWADLLEHAFSPASALGKSGWLAPSALEKAKAMLHDPMRLNGHTLFCYIMLTMWLEQED
jgi:asparagine synthase (glutamine-hydrolysing)